MLGRAEGKREDGDGERSVVRWISSSRGLVMACLVVLCCDHAGYTFKGWNSAVVCVLAMVV